MDDLTQLVYGFVVAAAAAVAAGSEHALRISAALLVGQLDLTLVQCQPTYIHVYAKYACKPFKY